LPEPRGVCAGGVAVAATVAVVVALVDVVTEPVLLAVVDCFGVTGFGCTTRVVEVGTGCVDVAVTDVAGEFVVVVAVDVAATVGVEVEAGSATGVEVGVGVVVVAARVSGVVEAVLVVATLGDDVANIK
jgi:hypothetical protein